MCTAMTYSAKGFYFGRTLDYDQSYGETVAVTPRNFPFSFRRAGEQKTHYALIGTACIADGYPLYYDAMNEKGLCMAGLNFVGNARYFPPRAGKINLAQFELIPYLLGGCASLNEVKEKLKNLVVTEDSFSKTLPAAQLHWLIADKTGAIVLECVEEGMKVYDNPYGVLTNNPPFPLQSFALNNYISLSSRDPVNTFSPNLPLSIYCRGMGGIGLPGDLSSQSRFVRAAFVRANSVSGGGNAESVNQFFHLLGAVEQQRGCCYVGDKCEQTIYTSCCDCERGVYYYTTYENHRLTAVDMNCEDLNGERLSVYPHLRTESVFFQNAENSAR